MDGNRFDDLARSLARGSSSRRSLIKGLVGGAAGGLLALIGRDEAGADRLCKPANLPQSKCNKDAQCCAGLVCEEVCQPGCRIGGTLFAPDAVNPDDQCQICLPDVSTVTWSVGAGRSCDDGDPCTSGDTCDANGHCAGTLVPPTITCPADITSSTAAGTCGATATFTVPTGTCADSVSCTQQSGASFGLGTTTVTCTATNGAGSNECSFTVTVEDGQDPSPQCPASFGVAAAPGATSAIATFSASATDNCSGVQVSCSPPSGSTFPIGDTTVTCTATDSSGEDASCDFTVTVTCTPDCAGKACGDPDGCGGKCVGTCPDRGTCLVSTCNSTTFACENSSAPQGTGCGDMCTHGAICDGAGNCTGGFPATCPEQTSEPCRSRFSTGCDPATGCIYPRLTEGEPCDSSDKCNPKFCTAEGSCQTQSVVCNADCQTCIDGECIDIKQWERCGGVDTKICLSGVCASPCGAACQDWCVEILPVGGERSFNFQCCPDYARFSGGGCCWKGNKFGTVAPDATGVEVCTVPEMICADGLACDAECCEISTGNPKGVCPSITQYCANNVVVPAGGICTFDSDCTETQGAGAKCTGLDVIFSPTGQPQPKPDSGTCCPGGYVSFTGAAYPLGEILGCCRTGTQPSSVQRGECCPFPDQNAQCQGCSCSLGSIRRCC